MHPPSRRAAVGLLIAILILAGCGGSGEIHRQKAFVLGTVVDIAGTGVTEGTFQEAVGAAFRRMRRIHNALSTTGGANQLANFNRAAHADWVPLEPPLRELLPRAAAMEQATAGAFRSTLGRLVALWGFREPPFPDQPPADAAIRSLLAQGAGDAALALRRRNGTLQARLTRPGAALDLGGIAKGFALDQAAAVLQEHGVEQALINAGGDMRALGRRGDRPWRVGIRHPRDPDRVLGIVALAPGEAIVTSGDYERFFRHAGQRHHHLLDPTTGRPARAAQSATVIGPRATETDAWSTALFVRGAAGLAKLGPAQPGLVIDADGNAHANAAMDERLEWRASTPSAP